MSKLGKKLIDAAKEGIKIVSKMQTISVSAYAGEISLSEFAHEYFISGGNLDAWINAGIEAANGTPGEGHFPIAATSGQLEHANVRQLLSSGGQVLIAVGHPTNANARNHVTDGGGQTKRATGQQSHAAPVPEPTTSQLKAVGEARLASSRTVLDTCKTHDGRAWGNVGAHELDSMKRDGSMAKAIKDYIGPLSNQQRFAQVRDLITAKQFQKLLDRERTNVC